MYYKFLSTPLNVSSAEQVIYELAAGELCETEITEIIKIYQQRRLREINFNSQDFFRDLQGYLQCTVLANKIRFQDLILEDESSRQMILKEYGYTEATGYGQRGLEKIAYRQQNKVIRFYYEAPEDFFYNKLKGVSEADIIQQLSNNLLTVMAKNVPGAPFDLLERALPLTEVISQMEELGQQKIIEQVNSLRNPVMTNFIETADKNLGLVVRLDRQGYKRVYLVAFDLDLRIRLLTKESKEMVLAKLMQRCFDLRPGYLDYTWLVKYIPQLEQLLPLPITTRLDY